jgi:hypothetical protein
MNNYIDLSYQDSSVLLNNNSILNNNIKKKSNLNNNDNGNNLIEGFGNFGRVNLDKCCPLEYMWSEQQKKCVKVCDGCAVGAYGDINYEFLEHHGNEFMSYFECKGDASGSYDFDKINKRYEKSELLTQHDLNYHIDSNEDEEGVQPSEEDPWAPVMGGMYQISDAGYRREAKQMNIREDAITDQQRMDGLTPEQVAENELIIEADIQSKRSTVCGEHSESVNINDIYNICIQDSSEPSSNTVINPVQWDSLCGAIRDSVTDETLSNNLYNRFCHVPSETTGSEPDYCMDTPGEFITSVCGSDGR